MQQQYDTPNDESGGLGFPSIVRTQSELSSISSVSMASAHDWGRGNTIRDAEGDATQGYNNATVGQHGRAAESPQPWSVQEEGGQFPKRKIGSPEVGGLQSPYTPYSAHSATYSPSASLLSSIDAEGGEMQQQKAAPEAGNPSRRGSYWKPMTAKPLFLVFFILCTISMVVLLDILLRISDKYVGLADASIQQDDSYVFTFLHAYLPLIVAIIYSQSWWAINIDIQRTEPYVRLSRPTGATGSASLFLDFSLLTTPFKALARREWIVFCSVVAYLIALLAIPPLQGTIFSINFISLTEDILFTTPRYFNEQNPLSLDWSNDQGIVNVQTMLNFGRNVSTSPWITRNGFVALPGSVPETLQMGMNETWEFETQVLKMDLECVAYQPNKVYDTLCDVTPKNNTCESTETVFVAEYNPHVNGKEYKFYIGYGRPFPADTPEDTVDWYFGAYRGTEQVPPWSEIIYLHRNLSSPFPGIPDRLILTWNKVLFRRVPKYIDGWLAVEQPEYELHVCGPKYRAATIPVTYTVSASDASTLDVGLVDRLQLNETLFYERAMDFSASKGKFDRATFEARIFGLITDDFYGGFRNKGTNRVLTGSMIPADLPYTSTYGGLTLMVNARNYGVLTKPGGFITESKKFAASAFANFVDVVLHKKKVLDGSNTGAGERVVVQGRRVWIKRRLLVLSGFGRALQGCFITCIVLACCILYLSIHRNMHLHQDPGSIAAKLAIINQNNLPAFRHHGRSSSKVLKDKFGNTKFRLTQDGQLQLVEDPALVPDELLTIPQTDIDEGVNPDPPGSWRPFMLRLRWTLIFILYVLGICGSVIALWKLSQRSGAIGPVGSEFIGGAKWMSIDFLWTTFPIFIVQVVKLQWGFLDETLRIFEPFARLLARMAPAKSSVGADYSSKMVGWVTFKAARGGAFLLAFITLISLLTEFLTVATGALFERELRPVLTTLPLTRPWKINTTPIAGSELYPNTLSQQIDNNYMLNSIFSQAYNISGQTPWTATDWAFAPVNIGSQSGGKITVTTIGVRARLDCESIPVPSEMIKQINFTVDESTIPFLEEGIQIPVYNWTRSSLEEAFGQDTAWTITDAFDRNYTDATNTTYHFRYHPNPFMAQNHSDLMKNVFKQQWKPDFKIDNYHWGYWDFFQTVQESNRSQSMTVMRHYSEKFLVFWAEGEVMGYVLNDVYRESGNSHATYNHLYRHKPTITLLSCHPIFESAEAEVTIEGSSQRVLSHTLLTTPSPAENATTFILPPPGTNTTDGPFSLDHYKIGYGTYFIPPLFNYNNIIGSDRGGLLFSQVAYEQRQSYNVSASPASYLAALPYLRKGQGKKLKDFEELAAATSRAFSTVFLEFAAVTTQVHTTTPGPETLILNRNWNVRNFVFVSSSPTEASAAMMQLGEVATHSVLSERVVLVPAAAVLVLIIMVAMIIGVTGAVWTRKSLAGRLPRAPFTVGSVLGWVYASNAAAAIGGGWVEKSDWWSKSYGMGWYIGVDGEEHWGVDKEPLMDGEAHWGVDEEPLVEIDNEAS